MTLPAFLKSRKFWALIIGAVLIAVHQYVRQLPLSDAQITDIAYLLIAFIIGTGLEDAGTGLARLAARK
jgi:hypothetical protein